MLGVYFPQDNNVLWVLEGDNGSAENFLQDRYINMT